MDQDDLLYMNEEQSEIVCICKDIQLKWETLKTQHDFNVDCSTPHEFQSFKQAFESINTNLGKIVQELARREG